MGLVTGLTPVVTFGVIVFTIFGAFGLGAFGVADFTDIDGVVFVETLGAGGGVLKTDFGFGLAIVTHPQIL